MPSSMYFHIIQNLNVPLKRDAHLMSPSKRCVVNVKLVFPKSSLSLFKDPLLDIFELADVDLCKMITCPDEAIICGSNQNLLKMKESPVPVTQWFWLSFQYYLQQIATCQARIIPCLHFQSSKHFGCYVIVVKSPCSLWALLQNVISSSSCSKRHITSTNHTLIEPQLPILQHAKQSWSIKLPLSNKNF